MIGHLDYLHVISGTGWSPRGHSVQHYLALKAGRIRAVILIKALVRASLCRLLLLLTGRFVPYSILINVTGAVIIN